MAWPVKPVSHDGCFNAAAVVCHVVLPFDIKDWTERLPVESFKLPYISTAHISQAYSSVETTIAWYTISFGSWVRSWFLKTLSAIARICIQNISKKHYKNKYILKKSVVFLQFTKLHPYKTTLNVHTKKCCSWFKGNPLETTNVYTQFHTFSKSF